MVITIPMLCLTHTFSPHSCTSPKSGFFLKATSKGVFPSTAFVGVLFINQTIWRATSPHKDLGSPLACNKAQIRLTMVQFDAQQLHCDGGVSWTVSFCLVPLDLRWRTNPFPRYSTSPHTSQCTSPPKTLALSSPQTFWIGFWVDFA